MSTTSYSSTGAFFDTGIGIARIHGQINYNISRWDNVLTFTSTYARIKYVRESGSWTSFTYNAGWTWRLYIGTGTQRSSNSTSGTKSVNDTNNGSSVSFTVSVGADTTSYGGRIGAWFSGDSQTYTSTHTMTFPAAGSPTGSTATASNVSVTTATLGASVSGWGSYSSAGTGQRIEYKKTTDGSWTTLAYSTSTSHTRNITGLTPGTEYQVRTYASNGSGKTANSSTITFTTLPAPNTSAALLRVVGVL